MNSRPGSSLRARLTSPPPSRALLELQKQGLELSISPPSNTLQVTPHPESGRSSASDLDKPLPLEPFQGRRRPSSEYSVDRGSVYSTDTTITNILRMYGEYRDLDDIMDIPVLHQPQAYRDTVAPLLIRRLSLSQNSSQHALKDAPREAISNPSLRSSAALYQIPSNKTAPSFTEFSRQLQERRDQLVSPLSVSSHRQAAYDQLAPPSPQVSSVELSISVSQTPPLPDAMSVTISDLDESDLLPPPLGMSSSSLPSPPYDDWERPAEFNPAHHAGPGQSPSQHNHQKGSWPENWLEDGFTSQSPESSPTNGRVRESFQPSGPIPQEERERVISYAEAKYPGMKRNSSEKKKSRNSSARSSMQQGVGNLLRSLSRKRATGNRDWPDNDAKPQRERQLAIPATPYQVYGAEVFSGKLHKKQQKEAEKQAQQEREAQRARRQRGKSISLASAYQNGQNGLVAGLRKLTGKGSQKRQRKLKNSIIVVGPTQPTSTVDDTRRFTIEDERSWI
ncbi:hypothetical protein H2200_006160 [Cladophialophora chaetospira]|uniref:Uncharacterized protein n=1 Tax=Cladophialophora chaetospira TaxID=386627 RepID=A0AA38XAN1_9EURO|nr:hypothetical protein H2200_006160 [Cladophialophora chaetospira]